MGFELRASGSSGAIEQGLGRRERVMEAALAVIAERGLATTRISDIADRAGMSPGHVLYYFRSKDLVLMEALRYIEDRMHEDAAEELAATPAGEPRLRRLLELNLPEGTADPGWTLWLEAWTLAPHDDVIGGLVAELEDRWVRLLAEVVRSGVEDGAFRTDDVEAAVTHLYATINGLAVRVVTGTAGLSFEAALNICLRAASNELGFRQSG